MHKTYYLNTKKYCGALTVDNNRVIVFDYTAPCYRWAAKRRMTIDSLLHYYKRKGFLLSCSKL